MDVATFPGGLHYTPIHRRRDMAKDDGAAARREAERQRMLEEQERVMEADRQRRAREAEAARQRALDEGK
jgi:hypothetical protein